MKILSFSAKDVKNIPITKRINKILNKSLRRLRKNKEFIIGIKEWELNSKKIKDYWDNEKNRLNNERLRSVYEYYYHWENTP